MTAKFRHCGFLQGDYTLNIDQISPKEIYATLRQELATPDERLILDFHLQNEPCRIRRPIEDLARWKHEQLHSKVFCVHASQMNPAEVTPTPTQQGKTIHLMFTPRSDYVLSLIISWTVVGIQQIVQLSAECTTYRRIQHRSRQVRLAVPYTERTLLHSTTTLRPLRITPRES